MLPVRERLNRWLPYECSRGWLGDAARVIIPKLEREIAAQVDRNPKGHDPAEGHGRHDESPVGNADAPNKRRIL